MVASCSRIFDVCSFAVNLDFLLRAHATGQVAGADYLLKTLNQTLSMMAAGGIYDHVGGVRFTSFFLLSKDVLWCVLLFVASESRLKQC